MRRMKIIIPSMVLIFSLCAFTIHAETTEFITYPILSNEKTAIVETVNLKIVQDDNDNITGIQCFDVRQDGTYALAKGSEKNCRVYIYDPNGVFQYGYQFCSNGDFGIFFYEDALAIYFVRGDKVAIYDANGVCIDVKQVMISNNIHHEYRMELLDGTYKKISDKEYYLERDLDIGDSYSRFVIVDENGLKTVLYDTSNKLIFEQVFLLVSIIGGFSLCIWGVYKKKILN